MTKPRKNGEDVLKKIAPLFIKVPRSHPNYMNEYMKQKRRLEKRNDPAIKQLADQAEKLFKDLEKTFGFRRTR